MKTTAIHHSADFDGLFCREIARKFLPDAELIGWDFGDAPINRLKYPLAHQFYILDLPVDRVFGENFAKEPMHPGADFSNYIWIDHHKSSIETHPKSIPGLRIDGVAACRLAWAWFTDPDLESYKNKNWSGACKSAFIDRTVSEPLAVRLAGEYDVWDKRDPRAELFQHGLRSRDLDGWWPALLTDSTTKQCTIAELEKLMEAGEKFDLLPSGAVNFPSIGERCVENLLKRGEAIQYFQTRQNESIIKAAGFTIQFEGLTFLACNHARYNSFLFTAGLKPEHDACFGFAYRGGAWHVSLYHAPGKEHHDLSLIASKYGGGGHRGACGFRMDKLPFI